MELKQEKNANKKPLFWVIFGSVFVGFINGFFGGGGGMVCVPILEKILGVENKKAHATTIVVIAALSMVSSVFYVAKNTFDWNMILFVATGVFLGGFVGAIFLKKLNGNVVRMVFAILMAAAGIQMVL